VCGESYIEKLWHRRYSTRKGRRRCDDVSDDVTDDDTRIRYSLNRSVLFFEIINWIRYITTYSCAMSKS